MAFEVEINKGWVIKGGETRLLVTVSSERKASAQFEYYFHDFWGRFVPASDFLNGDKRLLVGAYLNLMEVMNSNQGDFCSALTAFFFKNVDADDWNCSVSEESGTLDSLESKSFVMDLSLSKEIDRVDAKETILDFKSKVFSGKVHRVAHLEDGLVSKIEYVLVGLQGARQDLTTFPWGSIESFPEVKIASDSNSKLIVEVDRQSVVTRVFDSFDDLLEVLESLPKESERDLGPSIFRKVFDAQCAVVVDKLLKEFCSVFESVGPNGESSRLDMVLDDVLVFAIRKR